MRIPIIIAAAIVLQPTPGHSGILYARPDTEVAGAQYRWGNDVVPDAMPLKAALAIAGSVNGTRALEIRLLHASGAREMLYSVDLGSLQTASRWQGSENAKLIIRGQLEGSAAQRRALTTVVGRSLTDTICDLDGKNFCAETREQERPSAGEAREGMLNNVTEEMDRSASRQQSAPQEQSAPRDVRFRLNCFLLWESAFVEFAEMGFRECWFAAVASYASSNIALRNSGRRGLDLGVPRSRKEGKTRNGALFRGYGERLASEPFDLPTQPRPLRDSKGLGLSREHLVRLAVGDRPSSLLEPAQWRSVHCRGT